MANMKLRKFDISIYLIPTIVFEKYNVIESMKTIKRLNIIFLNYELTFKF
jgi:hypothetical protein